MTKSSYCVGKVACYSLHFFKKNVFSYKLTEHTECVENQIVPYLIVLIYSDIFNNKIKSRKDCCLQVNVMFCSLLKKK
jgi:hypothetical protein